MSSKPSQFVWYELLSPNAAAAQAFYTQVVGWQAADAGMPGMSYTLLSVGDTAIGGLMDVPPGAHPGWFGYVWVDDVDASAQRLQALGGKLLRPAEDIPGVGRYATVADPHGAVFYLFRDASDDNPPRLPSDTPGVISWHELYAGNGDAAFAFYSALFGWTKDTAVDMGPMGTYQLFAAGGPAIGGMMTKPPEVPVPFWQYYISVAAIDAAAGRATAAGGQVLMGPQEVPGGSWIVQCLDPQGVPFAMVAPVR